MKKSVIFILSLFLLSCEKDYSKIEFSLPTPEGLTHWDIIKVEGEHTLSINDTLILNVYCPRTSSCDNVVQLLSDAYDKKNLIKALGYTNRNSHCLWFAMPQVVPYEFIPDQKGIYTLEFIKTDETRIDFTIYVK